MAIKEKEQFQAGNIAELVRQGQDIMVQVVKDPLGTKGARLTTDITMPSRYLVFMPGSAHVGVSQRIESEAERERLKRTVAGYVDELGGYADIAWDGEKLCVFYEHGENGRIMEMRLVRL